MRTVSTCPKSIEMGVVIAEGVVEAFEVVGVAADVKVTIEPVITIDVRVVLNPVLLQEEAEKIKTIKNVKIRFIF